ncbi:hypothetical protein [Paenibacillus sp. YIM B09110]|uniref:hypothetical protein n=1 Tax=Paenibacillus sp. YIM B09110 TaxID=3126102 RepID=UPI00301C5F49
MKKKSKKQMIKLSDEVSAFLKKMIITLLILVVCSQAALQNDMIRHWLTGVDRWEGTRLK